MTAGPVRQRTAAEVIVEIIAGSRALASTSASWATIPPRPGAITDAAVCVEGLRRSLAELGAVMEDRNHA